MKLLVGLGNPGDEYARHRHNVGFMAVDALASDYRFAPWKKRFQGYACEGEIDGARALLLKPATYMNESGRAVGEAMRFLKLEVADLIVFHDELDIDPGRVKVKLGGGSAGHNGLKSITQCVGNEYVRVRIGIGHPGHKDAVSGYVLHDFSKAERSWLDPLLVDMSKAAGHLMAGKPELFASDLARGGGAAQAAPDRPAKAAPAPKSGHPTGERANKQKSALEDNLRKWLAAKK
jgi:PTH1 family peptidyl-tRNA hydrolase